MKTAMKMVCLVLAVSVFSLVSAASAATFTFTNDLDLRIAITVTYYDANSGVLTTRGWWHVNPGGRTDVTVNADASRGVYYAAYNKEQFIDSSTRSNPQLRRWASYSTFTFTSDAEPLDHDVWRGRFYRVNGSSVNIDARP